MKSDKAGALHCRLLASRAVSAHQLYHPDCSHDVGVHVCPYDVQGHVQQGPCLRHACVVDQNVERAAGLGQ